MSYQVKAAPPPKPLSHKPLDESTLREVVLLQYVPIPMLLLAFPVVVTIQVTVPVSETSACLHPAPFQSTIQSTKAGGLQPAHQTGDKQERHTRALLSLCLGLPVQQDTLTISKDTGPDIGVISADNERRGRGGF